MWWIPWLPARKLKTISHNVWIICTPGQRTCCMMWMQPKVDNSGKINAIRLFHMWIWTIGIFLYILGYTHILWKSLKIFKKDIFASVKFRSITVTEKIAKVKVSTYTIKWWIVKRESSMREAKTLLKTELSRKHGLMADLKELSLEEFPKWQRELKGEDGSLAQNLVKIDL